MFPRPTDAGLWLMGCCCDRSNQVHSAGGLERQRSCTDPGWLLVFAAFSAGLGVLLSWAVRKGGDPLRLLHGVDSQGNVCGRGDQRPLPGVPGSGQNTTGLTLLVLEDAMGHKRHCAASCPPGYRRFFKTWPPAGQELGYMGLVAIGLSVVALFLLRYCVALLVWLLLATVSLGMRWRDLLSLVTALFGEAGKALTAMPGLLLQPAWTLCFCVVIWAAGAVAMLVLLTAGDAAVAKEGADVTVLLRQDSLLRLGPWYLLLALCWLLQVAVSCQEVVVAGAAADWYFYRGTGWSAQCASLWRLMRYHLGSVLLGSLLVAIARVLKLACKFASRRKPDKKTACCLCSCCSIAALRFLNRNAFIMLAARGYSLCRAASEAWQLLSRNALRVATVNCVGDFVLLLAKASVVAGTTLAGHRLTEAKVGHLLWGPWAPLTAGALFSFLVAHCFLSVYEMTLDTLFLCFCHQSEEIERAGVSTIAVPDALAVSARWPTL
ncbi:hypothetical protein MRX96_030260 [Rhipicephalus microplus]